MVQVLDYVEVNPIEAGHELTARFVHQQLLDWSQQSLLLPNASQFILNDTRTNQVRIRHANQQESNVFLCAASTNPLVTRPIPVQLYGYCGVASRQTMVVVVNDSTLVRILHQKNDWKEQLTGEFDCHRTSMNTVFLDVPTSSLIQYGAYVVGSTRRTNASSVQASLYSQYATTPPPPMLVLQDESPHDTVRYLQRKHQHIRILSFGMLRAKYGVYADWGVACAIHATSMEWAVRNIAGSIVLLEMWDEADERLQRYLRILSDGLHRTRTIPFPENPMYGMSKGGVRRSVRLQLIAVTQPGSHTKKYRANVVRIPQTLMVETRLRGLRYALQAAASINNEEFDDAYLQDIASTISWARGSVFERIRNRIELVHERLSTTTFESILSEFGSLPKQITMQEQAGGNDMAKQALQDAMNPGIELESLGISVPTGILLYGPPGTGKTLLAKSLSRSMIVLHSTDVAQSRVGQGEKAVSEAFEAARKRSEPVTVIFIDEFQALFTDRSSFAGGSRVTTTLFQCMDNLSRWRKVDDRRRIIVLAATNTPWMIDEAFLRPGRFDRTIYIGLPTCEERKAILGLHLQNMKVEDDISTLSEHLARLTIGFSGADLAALCRAAVVQCLLELDEHQYPTKVREHHFEAVLKEGIVGPSSDQALLARIEGWQRRS